MDFASARAPDGLFDELTQLLTALLGVEVAAVAQLDPEEPGMLRVHSLFVDGRLVEAGRYPVDTGPCRVVLEQGHVAVAERLQELYPADDNSRALGAQSYAGASIPGRGGRPLGVVAVLSRRPMLDDARMHATLRVFAERVAAELDRPRITEALDQSLASYRAIFDASENAILVLDWNSGAILDVNRKACDSLGYTAQELRTLSANDISGGEPPYTRTEARRYVALAREGRCPTFEWRRRNKDGSLHWDEVTVKPAALGGRQVLLTFARDITDRKKAAEQMQLREEQYRLIFELSSDGLFLWNEAVQVVDVNPAGLAMYRYPRTAVLSGGYAPGLPPEYVHERYALIRRALAGETLTVESRAIRNDGTTFEAELRAMPFSHRGRPHALVVVRDVGERRARERELQRSEARLRATVEAAFDCVIAMDQDGTILEFNSAAERVFGWRREEVIGSRLSQLMVPERHRLAHDRGLAAFRQGDTGPMIGRLVETTARRRDGTEFPVEVAISVAAVSDGNIFVGHLRDITARRAAEAERSALEGQLRQAQKMEAVGQLTGGIAHDFNNILTSVMGYVVLGQERAEQLADDTLVRQLGQAHLAAQRARDLISQMLAFSRRQKGDPRPLALTPLTRQTLRLLRSTLPTTISLDAQWMDADASGDEAWVVADPVQLEQILFNLCINARDAMQGVGGITVRLGRSDGSSRHCASCRGTVEAGPWVELRVSDTGPGIPAELLDRIFDPFFSTKMPGQGSGMGLAMVHGIVHDHGGHVLVDSAPGQGATFTILLPSVAPADRSAAGLRVHAADGATLPQVEVLLVEDDPSVGDYLQEQLSNWGLRVTLLRDPVAALHWLGEPPVDVRLLLTDLTMPGMTGLQLAREARRLRPDLPVLLVTGNAAHFGSEELEANGVTLALKKPVDSALLRASLRKLLLAAHLQ
jgi:PAS domain S-box-containing protein